MKWLRDRRERKESAQKAKERLLVEDVISTRFNNNKSNICIHCVHEHTCMICYDKAVESDLLLGGLMYMIKHLEYLRRG